MTPLFVAALLATAPNLQTLAEQTQFQKTGRYEEAVTLCGAFEKAYPNKARCDTFGTTPEGRPMVALVVSDGALTPEESKKKLRPVMLFQGGIHAGEIDGKDAGFWFVRDVLDGKALPGLLTRVTLVFVPVFNIDGHERFGANNRPNQRGPEEMGWRVTSQNLNLNRDYAKADAPEMAAMIGLLRKWDPIIYLDLHVTDGAKFEHDVAVLIEPSAMGPDVLRRSTSELRDRVMKKLTASKHLPLPFYPSFIKEDDPMSGFSVGIAPPRFSHGYWPLRNRIGVLVETHSWRPYAYRVKTTYDCLVTFAEAAKDSGISWTRAAEAADELDKKRGGSELPLVVTATDKSRTINYRGYAYTMEPSEISGQKWIKYDEKKPQIWKVPLHDEMKTAVTALLPKSGWIVPAGYADRVAEKLRIHGFAFRVLDAPIEKLTVSAYRATDAKFRPEPYEGRQVATLTGAWKDEPQSFSKNSIFIPVDQPGIALLAHLLEPNAPDSLCTWGLFNSAFEQKEYMEDYVAEEEARRMMAADPQLKAEFDKKVAEDASFAKDPKARLGFFYRRHPAFDARMNLYPVFKLNAPLP
ncbi:MAG: M14 family metallopeptidase [Myxococcaceae bacterium]